MGKTTKRILFFKIKKIKFPRGPTHFRICLFSLWAYNKMLYIYIYIYIYIH